MSPWPWIVAAIVVNGIAGLVGGLLPEAWLQRSGGLIPFAAGAMLGAAFLDILPEATGRIGVSVGLAWALGGFVATALLEWALGHHHRARAQGPALLVSDALHNLGDGAVIAAAFLVSIRLGIATTLAVVVHEIPQEVGDYALLRRGGVSRAGALAALAGVQLTAAIGAAVVGLDNRIRWVDILLAVAGGAFVYIAATDLLPILHEPEDTRERRVRLAGFLLGVALLAALALI